jgi:hypothetical protein
MCHFSCYYVFITELPLLPSEQRVHEQFVAIADFSEHIRSLQARLRGKMHQMGE